MKTILFSACLLLIFRFGCGQEKYLTNEGVIDFYPHTVIEDITARNEKVSAIIDSDNGAVAIIVPMNEFVFERKLMQEHFNENYVESEIYPKATFSGLIKENSEVDYQTPGTYEVLVMGKMTIHGITRELSEAGTIEISRDHLVARTRFLLNPEDYGIQIPRVVRKNIAEKMEITAELIFIPK